MRINWPAPLSHMTPVMAEFVEMMGSKLLVNLHKDETSKKDIPILLKRLAGEVAEFQEQVDADVFAPNSLEELADMGNFVFLLYQFLRKQGVQNTVERFINEFYFVDTVTGRIHCKKRRSGSALLPGQEVVGTRRRGRVYIRAQHAASGATISLPRSVIVWWAATGTWPLSRQLRHRDDNFAEMHPDCSEDAFKNLTLDPPKSDGRLPFVSQYRPRGREGSPNFGRWVYQRRHGFALVRCGYYDTAEQAAVDGLRDWKRKTRDA